MSTTMWVLVGLAAWVFVGLAVALVLGRMIRMRDRESPGPPDEQPGGGEGTAAPRPRRAAEPPQPGGGRDPRP
ncbi:hypothetical protein [Pseudonocardia sp. NPDC046786]|uniref:hypothetical protein n=1 Tax=Pseudonocardia sp. NPDC046786 TaxID=3155471 RepID=UPI0033C3EDC2